MQTKGFIYHLVTPERWQKALQEGLYKPESLKTEGFIHFSTKDQVLETAGVHLKDFEELVVLRVPVRLVKNHLKWEEGRPGQLFPHLYAKLGFEAIENTLTILRGEDGTFHWEN